MSKFCIGIIKNKRTPQKDIIRYVYEVVNKEGLVVFFQIQDAPPFLDNYKQDVRGIFQLWYCFTPVTGYGIS